jgi:uncharacterized protein
MMMPRRILVLGSMLLAMSCTSPSPALYTLAIVPGAEHPGGPRQVELRSIALARYLERSQIVRSSEDYRLDVLANDWWGEPLDAMIGRVLTQSLAQRLPGSTVFTENGAISATPDATVAVNVQRLDQDHSGAVVLVAQIGIHRKDNVTRGVTIRAMPSAAGTPGLVAAMSDAVGKLADDIAGMLTAR